METQNIRNFSIVAHIDSGKSTLADRFLEITGTIDKNKMKPQFLDKMDLERERGITIKLKPVRMVYKISNPKHQIPNHRFQRDSVGMWDKSQIQNGAQPKDGRVEDGLKSNDRNETEYILNLVDTPGHADFSYEVSRALAAVEGTILLVDASKGIQAQTLANLELAKQQNLVIIPVINKIDLPQAETEKTAEELANLLGILPDEVIRISAKNGTNVEKVLEAIITKISSPKESYSCASEHRSEGFRALIFDSEYDVYKGVVAYVRVVDGEIKTGDKIKLMAKDIKAEAKEVGYFTPGPKRQEKISAGEIGYIATGIKEPGKVRVGDTITKFEIQNLKFKIQPLLGYQEPKPMVFASLYPEEPDDFDLLKEALAKLKLSDPSFVFEQETKEALGRGFKCGFLGTLHAEIVSERLKREFGLGLVISAPSVVYKIIDTKDRESFIYSASDWPETSYIKRTEEPWAELEIITPLLYLGPISDIIKNIRASYLETKYLNLDKIILIYQAPLAEIITNLYEKLKGASQGYASMSYKVIGWRPANLVKLDILIAGRKEEAFSKIVPELKAYQEGKALVEKLKEVLPAQQFSLALQAAVGGKIIARETISARRKDVTGYLYGGDYTRKRKLLEKQKKGKKELKAKGKMNIPPEVFLQVFRG